MSWFRICFAMMLFGVIGPAQGTTLTGTEVRRLCAEIGVGPAGLAATGMSVQSLQSALAQLAEAEELAAEWWELESEIATLAGEIGRAQEAARSAADDAGLQASQSALDLAQAEMASKRATLDVTRASLLEVVLDDVITGESRERVFSPAADGSGVPVEYRFTSRSPEELGSLRAALAAESRAERLGIATPTAAHDLLSQIRAVPEVAVARAARQANEAVFAQVFQLLQ